MATYHVYCVDEGLRIVPRELSGHLNLIVVREDHRDQRDALVRGEGMTDQLFPGRDFTAYEEPVKFTNA